MNNVKQKLYHYEETPPNEAWDQISTRLANQKVVQMQGLRGKSKVFFYTATAAAALIIIFTGSVFFSNKSKEKNLTRNSYSQSFSKTDSIANNHILERIIKSSYENPDYEMNSNGQVAKRYITIAGPEGKPVKISAKVATLILWADDEYPPRPVWNHQIDKWQQIMLSNISSSTSAGLMEVIQKSAAGNLE